MDKLDNTKNNDLNSITVCDRKSKIKLLLDSNEIEEDSLPIIAAVEQWRASEMNFNSSSGQSFAQNRWYQTYSLPTEKYEE